MDKNYARRFWRIEDEIKNRLKDKYPHLTKKQIRYVIMRTIRVVGYLIYSQKTIEIRGRLIIKNIKKEWKSLGLFLKVTERRTT